MRPEKLFPHSGGQGQSAIVFLAADFLQFREQFAVHAMIEHPSSDGHEFIPIVPVTNGIFHLAKNVDELRICGFFGQAQNLTQFFNLQTVGMKVLAIKVCRHCQFAGEADRDSRRFGRRRRLTIAGILARFGNSLCQTL
jgi:hypothetical protein